MSPEQRTLQTYNLQFTQDALTSQVAEAPQLARRIVNFIPSRALDLKRKAYAAPFLASPPDGYWWSYIKDHIFYVGGSQQRQIIVGWSNNIGTFLGKRDSSGNAVPLPIGATSPPGDAASGWRGDPLILYSDGLLYISDGVESSIYDGTDSRSWGLQKIPLIPTLSKTGGKLQAVFAGTGLDDMTPGPVADASEATMTLTVVIDGVASGGGADTFKWKVDVAGSPAGTFTTQVPITGSEQDLSNGFSVTFKATTGHTLGDQWTVASIGFPCEFFREYLISEYDSVAKRESMPGGRIRFTPPERGMYVVTLTLPAAQNLATGWTIGAADKFRIYASHVDGSTQLFWLAEIPVGPTFVDSSPFWGDPGSATYMFSPFQPAFRNQPTAHGSVGTKFNNRFAIRDPKRRSRIRISGFTEIIEQGGARGNPLEMFPGTQNETLIAQGDALRPTDAVAAEGRYNNISDYDNYVELPDEQFEIRAALWFSDGLVLGTEKSVKVMWGRNPEDPFHIGNTSTYGFGVFGKNSFLVTTHGLVIFTEDRRLVLDPVLAPSATDRTAQVIDIGWPVQDILDMADIRYSNRFQMVHWQFGRERDWLVVAMTDQNEIDGGIARYLVYDFTLGGWLSFTDVQATSAGIVLEDGGFKFLVGGDNAAGGADRAAKVLDGFTSSGTSAYQAAASRIGMPPQGVETRPANSLLLALLDFGQPEWDKSLEFLRVAMKPTGHPPPTVSLWFDPIDIDNLGPPDRVLSPPGTNGDNFDFRQRENRLYEAPIEPGRLASRIAVQFDIPAGGVDAALQGIEIDWRPVSKRARF
jgi:hypothetical protein